MTGLRAVFAPTLTLMALVGVLALVVRGARPADGRRHAHRFSTLRSYRASDGFLLALPAGWAAANVGARIGDSADTAVMLAIVAGAVAARRPAWIEVLFGPLATAVALSSAFQSGALSTSERLALLASIAVGAAVAIFGMSLRSHGYAHAARVATVAFCVTDLTVFMHDPAGTAAAPFPWRGASALALAIPICALAGYASGLVVPMISLAVTIGDIALALIVPRSSGSVALFAFAVFTMAVIVARSLAPSTSRLTPA
jgi:hypothetical protein